MFGKSKSKDSHHKDSHHEGDLDRPVNLYVHQRDKKGSVASINPYRLVIQNGQYLYEVPAGSGKFYTQAGTAVTEDSLSQIGKDQQQFQGFNSRAPMSQPAGLPDKGMLGEVKQKGDGEQELEAGEDHVKRDQAQRELQEQGGKAQQANPPQAPQTKGSFTSKPEK